MNVETLKQTQEIVTVMTAVIKSARLYHPGHRSVREMMERVNELFQAYLQAQTYLELEIDSEGLKWEGKTLLRTGEVEVDYVFRLYRDAIRMATFLQGLTAAELETFLNLFLKECPHDQDLATLCWEEDFNHIEFAMVEAFHRFMQQDSDEEKKVLLNEVENWMNLCRSERLEHPAHLSYRTESGVEPLPPGIFQPVSLSLSEALNHSRAMAMEECIERLLQTLESSNASLVNEAARNLGKLARVILAQADLGQMVRILNLLPSSSPLDAVNELRRQLTSDETLERLVVQLSLREIWAGLEFPLFCNCLSDGDLAAFLAGFARRGESRIRPLYPILLRFRPEALLALGHMLDGPEALALLAASKDFLTDEQYLGMADHPHREVRLTALRMFKQLPDPILARALEDPEKDIRFFGLSTIGRESRKELLSSLTEIIKSDSFFDKDPEERERWVVVTSMVGRREVEDFFLAYMEPKGLLALTRSDDMRFLAAKALGIIGSEKALPLLERESKRLTNTTAMRQSCSISRELIRKKARKGRE
jgi:HEAT repeat protein